MERQEALSILRRREVERRTGLSRSEIYRRLAAGKFPKQVRIGPRAVGWLESAIQQYLAELVAESRSARIA